jgi:hypothetical protein
MNWVFRVKNNDKRASVEPRTVLFPTPVGPITLKKKSSCVKHTSRHQYVRNDDVVGLCFSPFHASIPRLKKLCEIEWHGEGEAGGTMENEGRTQAKRSTDVK